MNVKLLFLLFIAGVSVKIYDDLNDNNLFEYFNILKEKDYINYFLIGFHYICWTIFALKLPICATIIDIYYLNNFFIDKNAFKQPYEFTGLILFSLTILYLLLFENLIGKIVDEYIKLYLLLSQNNNIIYIIIYIICIFCVSVVYIIYIECFIVLNTEFSYKKLISRFLWVINLIVVFIINHLYFPNIFNYSILYCFGYFLTSCIFQIILIRKDRIEKSLKKSKRKEIKKEKNQKK
jgi:hypothetical protein